MTTRDGSTDETESLGEKASRGGEGIPDEVGSFCEEASRGGKGISHESNLGDEMPKDDGYWTWDKERQRFVHKDAATGEEVLFPESFD